MPPLHGTSVLAVAMVGISSSDINISLYIGVSPVVVLLIISMLVLRIEGLVHFQWL